jgi:hypothetical protein
MMRSGADLVCGWPCAAVGGRKPPDAGGRAQYVPKFDGVGSPEIYYFPEAMRRADQTLVQHG